MRINKINTNIILAFAVALFLVSAQGCSVSRRCADPKLDIPETIVRNLSADSLCMADLKWSEMFQDKYLKKLIAKTLENNRDMLTAVARVRELEKLHRVAKANQLPSIGAEAYAERETYDYSDAKEVIDPEIGLKASLSWELDFFGSLRWANREALAEYMASVEAQRSMQMVLIAEVATAYIELIALDNELNIVVNTLETRRENTSKAKLRAEGGLTTEIPYRQAQVEFASTASLIPDLEKKIEIKKNEISLLAGEFPAEVERSLINDYDRMPDMLNIGIPSELIQRRPDIRAAEYSLKAAMAKVGIAWADRFPRFVISLRGGVENNSFSDFFSTPFTYIAGELTSPIFSFGKRKAKYEAAIQAYEQERYQYEKKVMEVFKEVNDAVISYSSSQEKVILMGNLKDASKKYVDIARAQYNNGYINYIDVLDAQRSYFNAEIDFSNAVRDEFIALIDLYKALGGGWQ